MCAAMCSVDPQCSVFVYLPAGCVPSAASAACYLKSQVMPSVQRDCRCTGFRAPANPVEVAQDKSILQLSNSDANVSFGSRGMTSISSSSGTLLIELDSWAMVINDLVFNSTTLAPSAPSQPTASTVQYTYNSTINGSEHAFIVLYELQEGWQFVRKSVSLLSITDTGGAVRPSAVIASVSPFDVLRVMRPANLTGVLYPSGAMGGYGAFLRYGDGVGLLAAAQNPFLYPLALPAAPLFQPPSPNASSTLIHVGYHPVLVWNFTLSPGSDGAYARLLGRGSQRLAHSGLSLEVDRGLQSLLLTADAPQPFVADAGLLSLYPLTPYSVPPGSLDAGTTRPPTSSPPVNDPLPARRVTHALALDGHMRFEYAHITPADSDLYTLHGASGKSASASASASDPSWLTYGERDAFRSIASSLYSSPPSSTVKVHIPWTENDYQIDMGNDTQVVEYVRIFSRLQSIGVTHNLYAACDSAVSSRANNTDAWGWEEVLWLNLGQDIRQGTWLPGSGAPLPPSTQQLVDLAASEGVALMPYIYPVLRFAENPSWLGPDYANLDSRALQDFLIATIVQFSALTGVRGAGYDYTFYNDGNATLYSQWYGWRRVLSSLRSLLGGNATQEGSVPYVVDNRQLSHMWGPWMWVEGSYAEPLQTDEGPYSWPAYLWDPHTDRQSANRQRQVSYVYAQQQFCPMAAMPGFINHQTDRFLDGQITYNDLNVRDFDFYGAPYSILSSIATGGLNNVVCGLPARDEGEYLAFPEDAGPITASSAFYRAWLGWTDENRGLLERTKPLPVPPGPGLTDGTYAIDPSTNTGYVFLFNPNARSTASPNITLDASLGLGDICSATTHTAGASASATTGTPLLFNVTEYWPVAGRQIATAACGDTLAVQMEGRAALVLSIQPLGTNTSTAKTSNVMVVGRGHRSGTEARLESIPGDAAGLRLAVTGWEDAVPADSARAAPPSLYAIVDALTAQAVAAATVNGVPVHHALVDCTAPLPHASFHLAAGTSSMQPRCGPGQAAIALSPMAAGPVFVHSQAITGMAYNASFTGGPLTGIINVPAAVFTQLAQRNATYPVPWTADDVPIAWLVPGRLIAYIDVQEPSTSTWAATLDGAPIPVQPVWSCRSLQADRCFSGFWLDLTAAGVTPDTDHQLRIVFPSLSSTFGGVYYDNVDTIYASTVTGH